MGTRVLVAAIALLCARHAWGAQVAIDAPDGCVEPATIEQEVTDLVGRPLASIPDLEFRLAITPAPRARWKLRLEAVDRRAGAPEAHVRQLEAASCTELADAAALAMAVSIQGVAPQPTARPAPAPSPAPAPAPSVVIRSAAEAPPPVAPHAWARSFTAALEGDAGDLPGAGLGLTAGAAIARGAARLQAGAAWFPSRDSVRSDGTGGRFQLAFGAIEACFAPRLRGWTPLACGGGELGATWATGVGVAQPGSGAALWRAGRAGLGGLVPIGGSLAFLVQANAVFPLARSQFVFDGMNPVYRPAPVAARLTAGLEWGF